MLRYCMHASARPMATPAALSIYSSNLRAFTTGDTISVYDLQQ